MNLLPDPPPARVNATDRPNLHPDDHNELAARVADVHALFPEAIDWSDVWNVAAAAVPAQISDLSGRLYLLPFGVPVEDISKNDLVMQPAPTWSVGTSYGYFQGVKYVYGADGVLYHVTSAHVATADTEPGVGAAWQTRWEVATPVAWYMLDVAFTWNAPSQTGFVTLRVDLDAASPIEPVVFTTWPILGTWGFNVNRYTEHYGHVEAATGRLHVSANGYQSGQGPHPIAVRGLVPFYPKVTP